MRSIPASECSRYDEPGRAQPRLSRRTEGGAPRPARASRARFHRDAHFGSGGREARRLGYRGAPRLGADGGCGGYKRKNEYRGAWCRFAGGYGLPADPGDRSGALPLAPRRPHARLRPRWPHHDPARRRALPRRDAQLRRHRLRHLPAGRGKRRRRARHGEGRPVREVPGERGLRPAQLAGPFARQDRGGHRADDGRDRRGADHGTRQGRPRRHAAPRRRSGGRRGADHHRAADHRKPQRRADRRGRGQHLLDADEPGRRIQRGAGVGAPRRHGAQLPARHARPRRAASARDRHQGGRGARRHRTDRLHARLSRHGEQRARGGVRRFGRRAHLRQGQRDHRPHADDGRRRFLLHARRTPRRLRLARPGRRPRRLLPAPSGLRFQRRGDSAGRGLPRRARRAGFANWGGQMRRFLIRSIFAGLVLFAAVPVGAVQLRWAAQNDILTLDPHSQNHATTNSILQHTYEGLTRYTKTFGVEPCLATGWKELSATHWRFNLRQGVKFHDGSPFTADDVVFSFSRILQPQGTMQIYVAGVAEVKKVDDYTVDFVLSGPNPVLLRNLVDFRIMSKAWAEKNRSQNVQDYAKKEESYASRNANGTGPYMIRSWEPDKQIVFTLNKNWWEKIEGNVTDVVYSPIKSDATRVAALLSGDVDLVTDLPVQDVERLRKDSKLKVLDGEENRTIFIAMDQHNDELKYSNVKGKNPFKDIRVRKALNMAVDREAIRRVTMRGLSIPAGIMVAPSVHGWSKDLDKVTPFDPAGAKKLLAEAGYPKGF